MKLIHHIALWAILVSALLPAQERGVGGEVGSEVAARVRSGGWFESPKLRRAEDGSLEVDYIADVGGMPPRPRFRPLLGDGMNRALRGLKVPGMLMLACHGSGDLLAMTDAEFHLRAVGVNVDGDALGQFLLRPLPSVGGLRGRAELLDRMLAIDLLVGRGQRTAVAGLRDLAKRDLPRSLRSRVEHALARLRGDPFGTRLRLDPAALVLPERFDVFVTVDNARLPDMSAWTAIYRRIRALEYAGIIDGRRVITPAMRNGLQVTVDSVAELPFALVHQYGNARIDHTCLVVALRGAQPVRFAWSLQAVGDFEMHGWQDVDVSDLQWRGLPFSATSFDVDARSLRLDSGKLEAKPRPARAAQLLQGRDAVVRVVVPADSALWQEFAWLKLPSPAGCEVRLSMGLAAALELRITPVSEAESEQWSRRLGELLASVPSMISRRLPALVAGDPFLKQQIESISAIQIEVVGDELVVRQPLTGWSISKLQALVERMLDAR